MMKTNSLASASAIDQEAAEKRGARRWLLHEILGCIVVALLLFGAAGRWDWPMGWALVGVYVVWVTANALLLIPRSPGLLAERVAHRFSEKGWDNLLLTLYGVLILSKMVVAGLDLRFGWSAPLPFALPIVAMIIASLGYALVTWAMVANAFFALVNRIQTERGHTVVTGGPYAYVRHPGYVGAILFELATPFMLGSLWALVPGGLAALSMVMRTALEDRSLQRELPGYPAYSQETPYRLLPGVW